MNTPKAVADEFERIRRDKETVRQALISRGIAIGADDSLGSYAQKIHDKMQPAIKLFKAQQFFQFLDERLPEMEVADSYLRVDLSWTFGRCINLTKIPPIRGIERAESVHSFIRESNNIKELMLPTLPNATDASNVASDALKLETAEIGDLPIAKSINNAFSSCASLRTATIGDAPSVVTASTLFHNCPNLKRVKLSLDGGLITDCRWMFNDDISLEEVEGVINISLCSNTMSFANSCAKLREIRVRGLSCDINFQWSTNLSLESVRFLIENAKTVSGKTIYLSRELVTRHQTDMEQLGEVATGKGWTISYR